MADNTYVPMAIGAVVWEEPKKKPKKQYQTAEAYITGLCEEMSSQTK